MKTTRGIVFLFFIFSFFSFIHGANGVIISNLKTEYTETPLGIDVESPRLSWQMQTDNKGAKQTAYQIHVFDETQKIVWNSKKIKSDISLNIKYEGEPLKPCMRYNWEVSVWDNKNEKAVASSWFETGLMNPDLSAWSNAKWIGGDDDDLVLYSHYLPVFRVNYTVQLDEASKSKKASFVYGANDERLMNKNKNIYHLQSDKNESYVMLELDISPLISGKNALLNVYRVGYHPDDKKQLPLKSYEISQASINNENKYQEQRISFTVNLGYTYIYVNNEEIASFAINPLGPNGDYIAFPVLGDIGFFVPQGQKTAFSDVEIRNFRSPSNILVKLEDESLDGGDEGYFKTYNPNRNSMPMLRTTFNAGEKITKARLYVTARGIYDFYINGKNINEDIYFNPGLTQYNKTHMYQTYDVTDYIIEGNNAMGAIMGEGWWSGSATYSGDFWNFFGDRQSLLAKLVITYENGEEEVVVTNPDSWNYYNNGAILYSSFFQGEVYDAEKDYLIKDWSTTRYNASDWKKTTEISLNGHIPVDDSNVKRNMPSVDDYSSQMLIGQYGESVKKIKELTAVSVEEVRPGVFVYDMGQNMAGVPSITFTGMIPGQEIRLRYAEVKYPDMEEYKDNVGMIMLENIRSAMAQDIYIAKGGREMINPRFTLHGFRYIEITGIKEALPLDAVKGKVLSSIYELASYYETSNPKVNKLWENIIWSTYSNFISIPTDCPQRNERLGWSGDISVFSRTATYTANIPQFLRRHMLAMRDVQRADGRFPDIAPLGGGFGGILWGSAGITVTWESYQQYGDIEILTEQYDAMKAYIGYLSTQIDSTTNILGLKYKSNWSSLADWLSLEYERNDKTLIWETYFIYDLELMTKIAALLGEQEDAEWFKQLYEERKAFFHKTYLDTETGKTIFADVENKLVDTQVSYALQIAFNIPDGELKDKVAANLAASVARENIIEDKDVTPPYSLMTGFIGTAWVSKALSDCSHNDIAYRLLQQTTYPSWLYSVEQGATTIWERLNSYTHTRGFGGNNRMNSFNHYSFGAVAAWMYNYSLGIERDEAYPGFKHFLLKPEPDPTGEMTYAQGYYDSMYGRIKSSWKIDGDNCLYEFTVPPNTSATLLLRSKSLSKIVEGAKLLEKSEGVRYLGEQDGKYSFRIESGTYKIRVSK